MNRRLPASRRQLLVLGAAGLGDTDEAPGPPIAAAAAPSPELAAAMNELTSEAAGLRRAAEVLLG